MGNKNINLLLLIIYLSIILLINSLPIYAISNTIIINEFVYDPVGSDLGYEWIELYNLSGKNIDINNWEIQIAGIEFKDGVIISNTNGYTVIEPYSYYTICERKIENCNYYVDKLGLQNGGNESDGFRIIDNKGYVIDTVIYDFPNTNKLIDDTRNIVSNENTGLKTHPGESLGRINHIDTDNSRSDFKIYKETSLNKVNPIINDLENTGDNIFLILLNFLFILSIIFGKLLFDLKLINKLKWQKD